MSSRDCFDDGRSEYLAQLPADKMLRELLAVIHGDGGDYTIDHGLAKSVFDAEKKYYSLVSPEPLNSDEGVKELAEKVFGICEEWSHCEGQAKAELIPLITAFTTSQLLQKGQKEVVWEGEVDIWYARDGQRCIEWPKGEEGPEEDKYQITLSRASGSKADEPSVSALQSPGASGQGDGGEVADE